MSICCCLEAIIILSMQGTEVIQYYSRFVAKRVLIQ
jgi:hypothetical protein